jgi:hypothetical protein
LLAINNSANLLYVVIAFGSSKEICNISEQTLLKCGLFNCNGGKIIVDDMKFLGRITGGGNIEVLHPFFLKLVVILIFCLIIV